MGMIGLSYMEKLSCIMYESLMWTHTRPGREKEVVTWGAGQRRHCTWRALHGGVSLPPDVGLFPGEERGVKRNDAFEETRNVCIESVEQYLGRWECTAECLQSSSEGRHEDLHDMHLFTFIEVQSNLWRTMQSKDYARLCSYWPLAVLATPAWVLSFVPTRVPQQLIKIRRPLLSCQNVNPKKLSERKWQPVGGQARWGVSRTCPKRSQGRSMRPCVHGVLNAQSAGETTASS